MLGACLGPSEVTAAPRLLAQGLRFAEAPVFDADGQLWCVEMENGCITRIESDGGLDRYEVGGRPSGLTLGLNGQFWFCDSRRKAQTGTISALAHLDRGVPLYLTHPAWEGADAKN